MKFRKIEDYQLRELATKQLYINKYNLDLMYSYEMARYWKEFFFDVFCAILNKGGIITCEGLKNVSVEQFKKNCLNYIRKYDLDIDIRDYIEIDDYISFDEWLEINPHNKYLIIENGIYLVSN